MMGRAAVLALILMGTGCQSNQPLPQGDFFAPLLADPKEPQFAMSLRSQSPRHDDATTIGVAGFGETFGLYRIEGAAAGDGLQFDVAAGLFAIFELDGYSNGLINADYMVGAPVTWRRGAHAVRARVYHQSSHLGDEVLVNRRPPERQNYNFDACELLYARDFGGTRVYGGGEYLFSRHPDHLDPMGLHFGAEYRATRPLLGGARPFLGLDAKSWQQHDWKASVSLAAGFEFRAPSLNGRWVRFVVEAFDGFNPYGQFYDQEIRYFGVGLRFGF